MTRIAIPLLAVIQAMSRVDDLARDHGTGARRDAMARLKENRS